MYKIIDGVAYQVQEVDLDSVKKETELVIVKLQELFNKKLKIEADRANTSSQYKTQIEACKQQIEQMQFVLASVEAKEKEAMRPYEERLSEIDKSIELVKGEIIDKKEIIISLLPEESKKLGF